MLERYAASAAPKPGCLGLARGWSVGVLVAIAMAVAVAAVMSEDAAASSGASVADSGGYVPVYSVCYSGYG